MNVSQIRERRKMKKKERSKLFTMRVSDNEMEQFKKLAEVANMSISTYIKFKCGVKNKEIKDEN